MEERGKRGKEGEKESLHIFVPYILISSSLCGFAVLREISQHRHI
jgi:hypothetical protein